MQPPAVNVNWCIQAKKTNNSSGGSGGTGSDCDCPDKDTITGWIEDAIQNINTGGLSIGTIFSHVSSNPPAGAHLLDGHSITEEAYPDFYKYIKNNKDNIKVLTDEEYEAEIDKYKFCEAFVISDKDVRLPTLGGYIPLGNNVPVIGNGMAVGLTDGTNYNGMSSIASAGITTRKNGYGAAVGDVVGTAGSLIDNVGIGITTEPEKSGLIVDTSNYPKDRLYWYIQVYNSTYTPNNVEAAVKDLSNVTEPTQAFKTMTIGWNIPDYAAGITLTLDDIKDSYTAPCDGLLTINVYGGTSGGLNALYINDKTIGFASPITKR